MPKWRTALGILAGAFLLLSSFAHSVLGGRAMSEQMTAAGVPKDLSLGLQMGWYWGGVAMIVFGVTTIWTFGGIWRGQPRPLLPVRLIAAAYLAFGLVAFSTSGEGFFLAVFGIPGVLLLVAAVGA